MSLASSMGPGRSWLAVYTKPRQEKALARELLGSGVPFFLPLVPKRIVYRRRIRRSQLPLFSGYLFLYGSEEEQSRAVASNRVSQVLTVHDGDRLISDLRHSAIDSVRCRADLGEPAAARPARCASPLARSWDWKGRSRPARVATV